MLTKNSGFERFVYQINIAIKRNFLKVLKERYFLLSGHRNVDFFARFQRLRCIF